MAILVPTCCQEVPNLTPRSPKRPQLMAKIDQESPTYGQDRPKSSPRASPRPQNVAKTKILHFGHFSKDRSQDHPKWSKKLSKCPQDGHLGPNLASRWPSWPQLGGSWRHLVSNLAPSCPIWARFWSIRALPKLTKISQDSF